VLRQKNVAAAIIGASRPDQIEENAKASGHGVDASLFKEAEGILSGVSAR
jgi:1-deoxyxylulose-5-phosphate synthase